MTITEYKLLLDYTISKHKYPPYTRQNEGLIYVGLPEIINFKSQNEKNCFVYYLCLFVAFDLKIYDKHRECYKTIKQLIGIPKFEYGLTSVFIYPSRIYDHYQVGFNSNKFVFCFNEFEKFILDTLRDNNIELSWAQLKIDVMNDVDIKYGSFGFNLCEYLREINSITQG